jgi:hypothetical protein
VLSFVSCCHCCTCLRQHLLPSGCQAWYRDVLATHGDDRFVYCSTLSVFQHRLPDMYLQTLIAAHERCITGAAQPLSQKLNTARHGTLTKLLLIIAFFYLQASLGALSTVIVLSHLPWIFVLSSGHSKRNRPCKLWCSRETRYQAPSFSFLFLFFFFSFLLLYLCLCLVFLFILLLVICVLLGMNTRQVPLQVDWCPADPNIVGLRCDDGSVRLWNLQRNAITEISHNSWGLKGHSTFVVVTHSAIRGYTWLAVAVCFVGAIGLMG